ncbi:MAG: alkaline phosphatase family protein, partial [Chloroflexota bacterium]
GLDCVPPELVFDAWREDLPTLSALMDTGTWGRLESITPPITVPAWMCMMTGKDPGTLGFYGFRNRGSREYRDLKVANSSWVREDTVWDILSRQGRQVVVVGVPATYPPKPVNGSLVGCFLTPSVRQSQYTYPEGLKDEIATVVGEYLVDVPDFRTEDKDHLLRQIYDMTDRRFALVDYLMDVKPWDFFMFVEMGTDRIHHGLWQYWDKTHRKYVPGNPYEDAIRQYYMHLDALIGDLVEKLGDDTVVMVVSDHGIKKMDGGICFNEWLIREGYLTLKSRPEGVITLEKAEVDWSRTVAWGDGGYYGRLFLNVRGREPEGIVAPEDVDRLKAELTAKLEALVDPDGRNIGTKVYRPEEIYRHVRNVAPDLIVYFGDLSWRSVGTIGRDSIYTFENDTGPDDANHARQGILIARSSGVPGRGAVEGMSILDVAPTLLDALGLAVPPDMQGRALALARL